MSMYLYFLFSVEIVLKALGVILVLTQRIFTSSLKIQF